MKNFFPFICLRAISLVFILSACTYTSGDTHRISNTDIDGHKLFVFSKIGIENKGKFVDPFVSTMTEDINKCGVDVQVANIKAGGDTLSLSADDTQGVADRISAFAPNYVLHVDQQSTTIRSSIINIVFTTTLDDYATNKALWTGIFRTNINIMDWVDTSGETLANEIVDKMKEDKILKSCPSD